MSEKNQVPPDMLAFLDQFATQAENIAVVVAGYKKKLQQELPEAYNEELIHKLTLDFNTILWTQIFQMARPKDE